MRRTLCRSFSFARARWLDGRLLASACLPSSWAGFTLALGAGIVVGGLNSWFFERSRKGSLVNLDLFAFEMANAKFVPSIAR